MRVPSLTLPFSIDHIDGHFNVTFGLHSMRLLTVDIVGHEPTAGFLFLCRSVSIYEFICYSCHASSI